MSKQKTKDEILLHIYEAMGDLENQLNDMVESDNPRETSCADKISYWISDYARYLRREKNFDPVQLIKYRKGDIVKINLGYRIGNEEGGLHFGVVMDTSNSKHSGVITIVPLTSQRPGRKIHRDSVYIGKEIFTSVIGKHDALKQKVQTEIETLKASIGSRTSITEDESNQMSALFAKMSELDKLRNSILKMKEGSVALVNQIVTVSKMRIYDPTYAHDVLYDIRLSPTTISDIDQKVIDLLISN